MRSRGEFLIAQSMGARVQTPHFILLLARGPQPPRAARLGITVTKKVGESVRRNRVRRLVREAFRRDPSLLPHGVDMVVIAKMGSPTLDLVVVQREWDRVRSLLFRKAREVAVSAPAAASSARLPPRDRNR
ncbi:MAG: hypothetical protein NVS3B20_25670 [Polyangiales bacterium]